MTGGVPERLRHEAAIYGSDDELLAMAVPFLRGGVEAGAPTFVGLAPREQDLVMSALGDDTAGVTPLATDVHYADPFRALDHTHRLLTDQLSNGAAIVRVLGQVPKQGVATAWHGWMRYEAAVNHLYGPLDVWSMCPYDARTTGPGVLADVERTHTHLASTNGDAGPNPGFGDPATLVADRAHLAIDALEVEDPHVAQDNPSPGEARRAVAALAATTRLDRLTVERFILAVSELVTNATLHGAPPVELRAWAAADRIVASVRDAGPGPDDPFTGYLPRRGDPVGGFGLWMVNQACDRVAMVPGPDGFTVHVTAGAPPSAEGPPG